jgi:hypothetical protein
MAVHAVIRQRRALRESCRFLPRQVSSPDSCDSRRGRDHLPNLPNLPSWAPCRIDHIRASLRDASAPYGGAMDKQHSHEQLEAPRADRIASEVRDDGTLIEMVYDRVRRETSFVVSQGGQWQFAPSLDGGGDRRIEPFSPQNNLIRSGALLLPSAPEEYGSEQGLIQDIQEYIHRYVDLTPAFERLASYYVLMSWVYDAFNEVPYLRVRGDFGTGKTRFLLVVGALCYKPFFASGASTVSPIFHTLDAFRGTLVIDEGDFRFSDEKAEIVKILNNGNIRGIPVLRTMVSNTREYNPKAFQVFGPKIVATRGEYDPALESRFLTEEMGRNPLRSDVPINLPGDYAAEALSLRNKLLLCRLRKFHDVVVDPDALDPVLEPRLNQIFAPLKSIVADDAFRTELTAVGRELQTELIAGRGFELETQLLEVIRDLLVKHGGPVSIKAITALFAERYSDQYAYNVNHRMIGALLRRKLHLQTRKGHSTYVIPVTELPHLTVLFRKYGMEQEPPDADGSEALK